MYTAVKQLVGRLLMRRQQEQDDSALALVVLSSITASVADGNDQQISDVIALVERQPINVRRHLFAMTQAEHEHTLLEQALRDNTSRLLTFILQQTASDSTLPLNVNSIIRYVVETDPKSSDSTTRQWLASPLWIAVRLKQVRAASLLLAHGADVNAAYEDASPLLACLQSSDNGDSSVRIADLLMEYGANVLYTNSHGVTPLMLAASNQPRLVDVILEQLRVPSYSVRVHVTACDQYGRTALHYAASNRKLVAFNSYTDVNVVRTLCGEGADLNAQDYYGRDAFTSGCDGLGNCRDKETVERFWSRVGSFMSALNASLVRRWRVWELIGADVALSELDRIDNNGTDVEESEAGQNYILFWKEALLLRQNFTFNTPTVKPFEAYVEPVTADALNLVCNDTIATLQHALHVRRRHLGNGSLAVSVACRIYTNYLRASESTVANAADRALACCIFALKSRPSCSELWHMMKTRHVCLISEWLRCISSHVTKAIVYISRVCSQRRASHQALTEAEWNSVVLAVNGAVDVILISDQLECKVTNILLVALSWASKLDCFYAGRPRMTKLCRIFSSLAASRVPVPAARRHRAIVHLLGIAFTKLRDLHYYNNVRCLIRAARVGGVSLDVPNKGKANANIVSPLYVCATIIADSGTHEWHKANLRRFMEILVDEGGAHWDATDATDVNGAAASTVVHFNHANVARYMNLQCLAARVVRRHVTGYEKELCPILAEFVSLH